VELNDLEAGHDRLERAMDIARDGDFKALCAAAMGVLGTVDEMNGERMSAGERYADASILAGEAGDAAGRDRWLRAAHAVGAG
jgi:hypothetical protein